jgi:hypothetical protein
VTPGQKLLADALIANRRFLARAHEIYGDEEDVAIEGSEARYDFAVDTALSWEGRFPRPGRGDYLVSIECHDGEGANVLVSRRYTSAGSAKEAKEIALSAYAERRGIPVDDDGLPSPEICLAIVQPVR